MDQGAESTKVCLSFEAVDVVYDPLEGAAMHPSGPGQRAGPGNLGGTPEVPTRSREDAVAISDNQLSQYGGLWLPLGERRASFCAPSLS
jgi:hypothetical protein